MAMSNYQMAKRYEKKTMHLHLFDEFAYPWGISRPGFKWPKFCGSFIPPLDMPPFQRPSAPSAGRALHEGGVGRIVLKTHREIRLQPALLSENRAQNSLQSGAL